jgi:hypothetical protein
MRKGIAMEETYLVDDVTVSFTRGKKQTATLTREDIVETVEASDRQKLLVAIGDTLDDVFGISNSYIMGLYNVVDLR